MTNNDVRRIYTQKVSELLAKGYQIHYETMSGSQGELAHIDLSDGQLWRQLWQHRPPAGRPLQRGPLPHTHHLERTSRHTL